jgi:PAS domain S-box-containing protein
MSQTADSIRILLVEDDRADSRLIREYLGEAGPGVYSVDHVTTLREAEEHLSGGTAPDLVLLDLSLPDSQGLETVTRILALKSDLPVVVLTGSSDERLPLEALRAGAQDYLPKGSASVPVLSRAFRYAMERAQHEKARRTAEEVHRESEARFRTVLQNSHVIVSTVDRDLRYTWIYNPHPAFRAEDVLGKRDDELVPPDHVAELMALKREVLESGEGERREVRIQLGPAIHFYDVTALPLRDTAGEVTGVTVAATDVTEHRRVAKQKEILSRVGAVLASSIDYEEMLRSVGRLAVPEIADWCVLDLLGEDDRLHSVQVHAADPRKEELLREMLANFPHDDGPDDHPVGRVLRRGEPLLLAEITSEMIERSAADKVQLAFAHELAPISSMIVPLVAGGRTTGAITFTSAESGRRYDEADLALAEELGRRIGLAVKNALLYQREQRAVRAREEVLGVVAHDLRNPLNAIGMYAQLLADPTLPDALRASHSEIVQDLVERMDRMIGDLLELSRIEAGRLTIDLETTSAGRLLDAATRMFAAKAAKAGIELKVEVEAGLPPLKADRDRLLQVLSNLIGNALRFTGEGGVITLRARRLGEETVELSVSDTGRGIAPEHLEHVFDRYWQARSTRRGGAGLGLAIVKGIVEAHGGRVRAESQPDVGSTFYCILPSAVEVESKTLTGQSAAGGRSSNPVK